MYVSWYKGKIAFQWWERAAPLLLWILSVYVNGWGIEIFKSNATYWPITAMSRMCGIEYRGFHILIYFGRKRNITWLDDKRNHSLLWVTEFNEGRLMV